MTEAIREVDPGRIVILAGGQWSSSFDMFGPPFAANLAYTYHSFWASTKRDSIQRHLNFSNRYDVPLFLGETGELTDEWNERFRKLHEAHGIGWSFWTYKNLDTPSTVVSIPRPEGWDEIVAFADGTRDDKPPDALIDRAMAQYLDGMRLGERDGALELSRVARPEGRTLGPDAPRTWQRGLSERVRDLCDQSSAWSVDGDVARVHCVVHPPSTAAVTILPRNFALVRRSVGQVWRRATPPRPSMPLGHFRWSPPAARGSCEVQRFRATPRQFFQPHGGATPRRVVAIAPCDADCRDSKRSPFRPFRRRRQNRRAAARPTL